MTKMAIGNLSRTLALISAGALLGVFLLGPLSVGASHRERDLPPVKESPITFVLESTTGLTFDFILVENGDGEMEFTNVPRPKRVFIDREKHDD